MMQAVRVAAPRPVPSGRAGIEPAKTVESRRFLACRLSTFHDRARCSCSGRRHWVAVAGDRLYVVHRRGLPTSLGDRLANSGLIRAKRQAPGIGESDIPVELSPRVLAWIIAEALEVEI